MVPAVEQERRVLRMARCIGGWLKRLSRHRLFSLLALVVGLGAIFFVPQVRNLRSQGVAEHRLTRINDANTAPAERAVSGASSRGQVKPAADQHRAGVFATETGAAGKPYSEGVIGSVRRLAVSLHDVGLRRIAGLASGWSGEPIRKSLLYRPRSSLADLVAAGDSLLVPIASDVGVVKAVRPTAILAPSNVIY
jgi:hypothetical protein